MKELFENAFLDMVMFGTGIIEISNEEIKHIPFIELNQNDELELEKGEK